MEHITRVKIKPEKYCPWIDLPWETYAENKEHSFHEQKIL